MAKPSKAFREYLDSVAEPKLSYSDYSDRPATTFLTHVVEICDSFNHCLRHFPKTKGGEFAKSSRDSLYTVSAVSLAAIMSHLETFQRLLFAGLLEHSRHLQQFQIKICAERITKWLNNQYDVERLLAFRGQEMTTGHIICELLPGWHNPTRVNEYVKMLVNSVEFYSKRDVAELKELWQFRHSIVHTGGWLTIGDAQKVDTIAHLSSKPLLFAPTFIVAVGRRFHRIVSRAMSHLEVQFRKNQKVNVSVREARELSRFFKVKSPRQAWLP